MILKNKIFTKEKNISLLLPSLIFFAILLSGFSNLLAGRKNFTLSSSKISFAVNFEDGKLVSEKFQTKPEWSSEFGTKQITLETDGDFTLNVMWTGWCAPGKINNADNPVIFSKANFRFDHGEIKNLPDGTKELRLYLTGYHNPIQVKITYQLGPEAFYLKRRISLRDTLYGLHFLRKIWPRSSRITRNISVIKKGGFGQPVAFRVGDGGAFFGLEYPTSDNSIKIDKEGNLFIRCGEIIGKKIGKEWLDSEWTVTGLTPDRAVKRWFFQYLDKVRVAPLKPYILYNSWYDLRSPVMVKDSTHIVNERNVMRIIDLFKKNMVDKYDVRLDAFVLDDGWDIYRSDWVLRKKEFPNGLKPIADELAKTNTTLGLWFGPIGGYSHRDWRIEWMKKHGYETVGTELCLAGENYHQLFKKRVIDFVEKDGIGYYKWDGIQFSCSEPDHGHPVGIYSRRAVMDSVIDLCSAVRNRNPDIFLNITSGTWLSPWWVKYANQIWMQGSDYGYANVPSISRRDAAITYRDFVLFDDLCKKKFWFPIANLMTHGIIKGNLQQLGGEEEPLDKFTDNALLYFARGVSMWELYISPELLTDNEWNSIAKAVHWAKDRFPILKSTEMIGGDPGQKKAYGYVHFSGKHGIIAARNPFIEPKFLKVTLSPAQGLDPDAASLVLERVYPTRWISPQIYAAGATLEFPLDGYETAIYEIYPLKEAKLPLLAGVTFDVIENNKDNYKIKFYDVEPCAHLLNPEKVDRIKSGAKTVSPCELLLTEKPLETPVKILSFQVKPKGKSTKIDAVFDLKNNLTEATLVLLIEAENSNKTDMPDVKSNLDGKSVAVKIEQQKKRWKWIKIDVNPGQHKVRFIISAGKKKKLWKGKAALWLICREKPESEELLFKLPESVGEKLPMPPRPWPTGEIRRNVKIGEEMITS